MTGKLKGKNANLWDGFFKNDEDRIIKKVLMLFRKTQCIMKTTN